MSLGSAPGHDEIEAPMNPRLERQESGETAPTSSRPERSATGARNRSRIADKNRPVKGANADWKADVRLRRLETSAHAATARSNAARYLVRPEPPPHYKGKSARPNDRTAASARQNSRRTQSFQCAAPRNGGERGAHATRPRFRSASFSSFASLGSKSARRPEPRLPNAVERI